jgi:hypothetical protein
MGKQMFIEVPTSSLGQLRGKVSVLSALILQIGILCGSLLWQGGNTQVETKGSVTIIDQKSINYLGARESVKQKEETRTEDMFPQTPLKIIDTDSQPESDRSTSKAKISIRFVADENRRLQGLLLRYRGSVGFGDEELLTDIFEPRGDDWARIDNAPVLVDDYYAPHIDERHGRYAFADQLRRSHRELVGKKLYAVFPPEVQLQLERGIRAAGPPTCRQDEKLQAVVVLAEGAFELQSLSCYTPSENEKSR